MRDTPDYDSAVPRLQSMFRGATRFGLTEGEVWQVVDDCLHWAGRDAPVGEYLDDLAGALATRIVLKQQRLTAGT